MFFKCSELIVIAKNSVWRRLRRAKYINIVYLISCRNGLFGSIYQAGQISTFLRSVPQDAPRKVTKNVHPTQFVDVFTQVRPILVRGHESER